MSILNGAVSKVLRTAFSLVYDDGILTRVEKTYETDGDISESSPKAYSVKVQVNQLTEEMRKNNGVTDPVVLRNALYTGASAVIFILQNDGVPKPVRSDSIVVDDRTWIIESSEEDPASAYWSVLAHEAVTNG